MFIIVGVPFVIALGVRTFSKRLFIFWRHSFSRVHIINIITHKHNGYIKQGMVMVDNLDFVHFIKKKIILFKT